MDPSHRQCWRQWPQGSGHTAQGYDHTRKEDGREAPAHQVWQFCLSGKEPMRASCACMRCGKIVSLLVSGMQFDELLSDW